MGGGDGLHIDLSQGDGALQSHEPGVDPLYPAAELPAGPGGGKKRAGCFFQKGVQPGDMVGMGVGDQNSRQVCRSQSQFFQSCGDPAAGDPGVDQQMGVSAGEHSGVSRGAAGKRMYGGQENTSLLKNVRRGTGRSRPTHSLTDVKFS